MTYEEAKPFLKEGIKVRVVKCNCGWDRCVGKHLIEATLGRCFGSPTGWKYNDNDTELWATDELEILTNSDGSPWIGPRSNSSPFKVGDRVRVKNSEIKRTKGVRPAILRFNQMRERPCRLP